MVLLAKLSQSICTQTNCYRTQSQTVFLPSTFHREEAKPFTNKSGMKFQKAYLVHRCPNAFCKQQDKERSFEKTTGYPNLYATFFSTIGKRWFFLFFKTIIILKINVHFWDDNTSCKAYHLLRKVQSWEKAYLFSYREFFLFEERNFTERSSLFYKLWKSFCFSCGCIVLLAV